MAEQKAEKDNAGKEEQPKEAPKKEKIKRGDFIEIDYIGSIKDSGMIFDTTDMGVAKKEGFYNESHEYGPAVICVGEHNIVKGIDKELEGKDTKTEYLIDIPPEEGFGRKNAKLIQLVSTSKFLKQNINPMPGLQVNIDGNLGTIKNVSGGRTMVDFNHPLASHELKYKIRVNRIVHDDKEKVKSLLAMQLNLQKKDLDVSEIKEGKAVIKTKKKLGLPKEITELLSNKINELVPAVKSVEFEEQAPKTGNA